MGNNKQKKEYPKLEKILNNVHKILHEGHYTRKAILDAELEYWHAERFLRDYVTNHSMDAYGKLMMSSTYRNFEKVGNDLRERHAESDFQKRHGCASWCFKDSHNGYLRD